jgi:hypothetical protein
MVLVYGAVSWAVTIWLVVARSPIVAPDLRSAHPAVITLMVIHGFMIVAVRTPREAAIKRFWSGLRRLSPRTLRAIRISLDVAEHAFLIVLLGVVALKSLAPEAWTAERAHAVATAALIALLAYPPIQLSALAIAGREAFYVLRGEEHELLSNERPTS